MFTILSIVQIFCNIVCNNKRKNSCNEINKVLISCNESGNNFIDATYKLDGLLWYAVAFHIASMDDAHQHFSPFSFFHSLAGDHNKRFPRATEKK